MKPQNINTETSLTVAEYLRGVSIQFLYCVPTRGNESHLPRPLIVDVEDERSQNR